VIEEHLSYRPRVSRETRRLLMAALLAVAAIWILARIRFPEQQTTPNPVAPLLSQLAPRYRFADLASDVSAAQTRIAAALAVLPASPHAALRLPAGLGLAMARAGDTIDSIVAQDRASGLTLVRLSGDDLATAPAVWIPERLDQPRYLLAASPGGSRIVAAPVLVNALDEESSPLWPDPVWVIRGSAQLPAGAFVFTGDALLVGLAIDLHGVRVIVPGSTRLAEATRLLVANSGAPGNLGLDVTDLTAPWSRATAATQGVVVSHVDSGGPAARSLAIGDVIETVDGTAIGSWADWQARTGRLVEGQSVMLRVRRAGVTHDAALTARPATAATTAKGLGLSLRRVATGAEVTRVEPGTAASAAGLRAGDVVVQFGGIKTPSPAGLRNAFVELPEGGAIVAGITRGETHQVVALEKDAAGDR